MVTQLILPKGLFLLINDLKWMALATGSLPVPLSPLDQYGNVRRGDLVYDGLHPFHLRALGEEQPIEGERYYWCHQGDYPKNEEN